MRYQANAQQWSVNDLRQLTQINYGRDARPILDPYGAYPVYGTAENNRYGTSYLYDGESIVLGRKGTIDRVQFVSGPFWTIDTAYFLSKFSACEPKWLYYVLSSIDLRGLNEATGVPSLAREVLYRLSVLTPSQPEQSKIAEVLSTVDRAIAQTEALIAKQQRIKTGLMQDLLTLGIDERGQLRTEATHAFKDSPLGRIPVEWEMAKLGDVAELNRGKFTHRPRDDARFYGGAYPFIQTGDVAANVGRWVNDFSQTLSIMGMHVSKEFPKGTIAITIAANIADTAILGRSMYFPDSVVGAVVKQPNSIRFIEMTIRSKKTALEQLAPKSAQSNINLETLRPLVISLPKPDEQARIASAYEADDDRQVSNERSLRKLRHLKTALMQDLLTGKVRVTPLLQPAKEATA